MEHKEMVKNEQNVPESTRRGVTVTPPVDIYENEDELLLISDLPGVARENLKINLDNDQLSIDGHRDVEYGDNDGTNIETMTYLRSFTIPKGIDAEGIRAELNKGVLHLHLPKSPALKPREIEIKSS